MRRRARTVVLRRRAEQGELRPAGHVRLAADPVEVKKKACAGMWMSLFRHLRRRRRPWLGMCISGVGRRRPCLALRRVFLRGPGIYRRRVFIGAGYL